jgi:hypothetical protein
MIKYYIPCERRRMRLDRILISESSQWIPASPVRIFGNKPIDPKDYLFLSDHFGLMVEIKPMHASDVKNQYQLSKKAVKLPHMNLVEKAIASIWYIGILFLLYFKSKL